MQVRTDAFTFSKLKPYENWKVFVSEAKDLWSKYCDLTKPKKITRLGLRYINRICLPLPIKSFKEFIRIIPEAPKGIPKGVSEIFLRMVLRFQGEGWEDKAIITETIEPVSEDSKVLPFILDIDVYNLGDYSVEDSLIWKIFERLRVNKNILFFNGTTPKAKEMFR